MTRENRSNFYHAEEFRGPFVGYTLCDPTPKELRITANFDVNGLRYRGPFEGVR